MSILLKNNFVNELDSSFISLHAVRSADPPLNEWDKKRGCQRPAGVAPEVTEDCADKKGTQPGFEAQGRQSSFPEQHKSYISGIFVQTCSSTRSPNRNTSESTKRIMFSKIKKKNKTKNSTDRINDLVVGDGREFYLNTVLHQKVVDNKTPDTKSMKSVS